MVHIFVFAFDLTEASQIRRIKSLQKLDYHVQSAAFRRANMNADFVPDWQNTDLGFVANERYGNRLIGILRGIRRVMQDRTALRRADVIMARNLDLLVIAWVSRWLAGAGRVPLVYECLDIHKLFTTPGFAGSLMRWCERQLLARIQLLVVSSPGFITHYFKTMQDYRGPHRIIENKLWFDGKVCARPKVRSIKAADAAIHLGWVGSIRCAPSLRLLMAAADHFEGRINVRIHGNVHRHALPDFDEQILQRANVTYFGPYKYPTGLASVYADCDVVWAQDLWQRGANSDWLLPNRIYEASWFGCPSIAVEGTETGRKVAKDSLGFTVTEPSAGALIRCLEGMSKNAVAKVSNDLLAKDDTDFVLRPQDVKLALEPVLPNTVKARP
ncbi:MAG: glycosyltransferase [Pseudomonadota bacterium]